MGKCAPAKGGKAGGKAGGSAGGGGGKRKGHPANMFILYYLDMFKKYGGNMYCVAKECGRRWRALPQSEKDKYKRQYCSKCRACKSCTKPSSGGAGGGGKKGSGGGSGGGKKGGSGGKCVC